MNIRTWFTNTAAARCGNVAVLATALLVTVLGCHDETPEEILASGKKLYSQYNEELVIRSFFDDRRGGVFVDVGSWNWRDGSTTYYLEEHLGWTGIAIDAQASLAPGYEKNRPGTKFFSYIVTDHSGGTETLFLGGQISSTDKSHFDQFPGAKDHVPQPVEVPTITLNDLLTQNGIEHIDFLSMDIEGSEPQALAGFDIGRFRPELVCIEAAPRIRERIMEYFSAHGYERLDQYFQYDSVNW